MLAFKGLVDIHIMVVVAFAGVLIGDSTIFFLGHRYGSVLTRKPFFEKILSPARLATIREKFHERGNKIVFAGRFMPGLRTPIFFTAGSLHLPYRVFIFYDGMAALISVPVITYVVFLFGAQVDYVIGVIRSFEHGMLLLIVSVIAFTVGKFLWGRWREKRQATSPQ